MLAKKSKSVLKRMKKKDASSSGEASGPTSNSEMRRSSSENEGSSSGSGGGGSVSGFAAKMSAGSKKLSKGLMMAQQSVMAKTGNAETTQDTPELASYTERAETFKQANKDIITRFEQSQSVLKQAMMESVQLAPVFSNYAAKLDDGRDEQSILVGPLLKCAEMHNKLMSLQQQNLYDVNNCLYQPLFVWNRGDVREARYRKRQHDQLRVEHDALLNRFNNARENQSKNLRQIAQEYEEVKQRFETSEEDCLQMLRDVDERNEFHTAEMLLSYLDAQRLYFERAMSFFWETESDMEAFRAAIKARRVQHEADEELRRKELERKRGVVDEATRVFGVDLDVVMAREENREWDVPVFMDDAVTYLQQKGLDQEGIFRLSGSKKHIDEIKYSLDCGDEVHWDDIKDPNVVAGVVKEYIRDLPVPLMTYTLYNEFVRVGSSDLEQDEMLTQVIGLVAQLPAHNKALLEKLMELCQEIAEQSSTNMMTSANLAIVFAPNILKPNDGSIGFGDTSAVNTVVKLLIDEFDLAFSGAVAATADDSDDDDAGDAGDGDGEYHAEVTSGTRIMGIVDDGEAP